MSKLHAESAGVGPTKAAYEKELKRLQIQLVEMQQWAVTSGARVLVIFEGRDAAGKGGAIKRVIQYLNPRSASVVALPTPSQREKGQSYFQRYLEHLRAAGEILLMDRSWYNRAGVEHVLGYCTPEQYEEFLGQVASIERMLVEDGIILLKYWFSVSDEEQPRRFKSRLKGPMRRWKLSDIPEAPWWTVESDNKKSARLNMISHLLSQVPYKKVTPKKVSLPERPRADSYERPARELYKYVPDHAADLGRN
jgi:polyphosphate kinase 2